MHKLLPCRPTAVELHPSEPQLGGVQQVQGRERHTLVLRSLAHVEVALAMVELGKGGAGAVKLRELQLVGGGGEIAACGSILIRGLPLAPQLAEDGVLLDCGLERGHLVLKGLQGFHLHLNGI
jgi:hypothetical protein